jgi:putative transposase
MSAIGALAYHTHRESARVFLRFARGSVGQDEVVTFVRHLRRHVRGEVILIWDGLSSHWTAKVRRELRRGRRIAAVRLPAYAPELNPVEALWAWLKQGRLANIPEEELDRLASRVRRGVRCGRRRPLLLCGFLAKAGLTL